ncbi:hypothetical protein GGR88_000445 [Sphingomonas jejuensis]|uniref:Transposase n=1 Tax=Sphingomonas jejuensis TaxID=904715 RepID=A0ABX0XJJ9_9SPHN|nr:transposase [Sphingomonas jejuensis]NJC32971.1 hypothetical protein [Sphingomonas jejuensis]
MPRDITVDPAAAPISQEVLVDWLMRNPVDPRDDDAMTAAGAMLHRFGTNPDAVAQAAKSLLMDDDGRQDGRNRYGGQVLILHPGGPGWFLRAAIWPAADDLVVRASGTAPFFYGVAHDHNFSFLTTGHHGPGYWSDYWEHDGAGAAGLPGEAVALVPRGRDRLTPGRTMMYRAHRDVHRQLPPDSLSVSINIMFTDPLLPWRDQYRFDPEGGVITGLLGTSATETLVSIVAHIGGPDGQELATDFARTHPSARLRASAWLALADATPKLDLALELLDRGAGDPAAQVSRQCRAALEIMIRSGADRRG